MAEEVRFFLRTALYSAVIAVIYWFASFERDGVPADYDWAGTTLLAFTVFACGAVAGVLLFVRGVRPDPAPRSGSLPARVSETVNRLVGLEHGSAERVQHPLAGGPELLPTSSPWPVVTALAATLIVLGLIYGPWLTVPGAVLVVIGVWGWLSQG
jgi:hypothetical protein